MLYEWHDINVRYLSCHGYQRNLAEKILIPNQQTFIRTYLHRKHKYKRLAYKFTQRQQQARESYKVLLNNK